MPSFLLKNPEQNPFALNYAYIYDELHKNIKAFAQEHETYTEQTKKIFKRLINEIKRIISRKYPKIEIRAYGSHETGLAMPWSDIDLVMVNRNVNPDNPFAGDDNHLMMNIETLLGGNKEVIKDIKYIKGAAVPVIKLTSTAEFLNRKVDITLRECKDSQHSGEMCVALVKQYIKIYKMFKPMVLVLKQLIFTAKVHDPYQGGLSSYGLILLVVAYLQYKQYCNLLIEDKEPNLGFLFVDFLNMYSSMKLSNLEMYPLKANEIPKEITIRNKTSAINGIVIYDPLDFNNNVTKSTYNVVYLENLIYFVFFSIFHKGETVLGNIFESAKIYAALSNF